MLIDEERETGQATHTKGGHDATKDYVLGSNGSRGDRGAARRLCLPDHGPTGGRELPPREISTAVACPPRHREAGRSHRAAPATAADVEGMGLRRLYLHVDRSIRGALPRGRRRLVFSAYRVDRVAGSFVRHAPGESPRFGEGDAARRSRSKRDINAVTCSAGFMACTSCCRWECSRGGGRCRGYRAAHGPFSYANPIREQRCVKQRHEDLVRFPSTT